MQWKIYHDFPWAKQQKMNCVTWKAVRGWPVEVIIQSTLRGGCQGNTSLAASSDLPDILGSFSSIFLYLKADQRTVAGGNVIWETIHSRNTQRLRLQTLTGQQHKVLPIKVTLRSVEGRVGHGRPYSVTPLHIHQETHPSMLTKISSAPFRLPRSN